MVFLVRSRVDARIPAQSREVETACYEPVSVEFEVANPFAAAATFEVRLAQECVEAMVAPPPKAQGAKKKKDAAEAPTSEAKLMAEALANPFATKTTSVFLEPNAKANVTLTCVPFTPGTFRCELILLSKEAGELTYEAVVKVTLPKPTETLSFKVVGGNDGSTIQRLLRLPSKNGELEAAMAAMLERFPTATRTKCRAVAFALCRPTIGPEDMSMAFRAEVDSPFFSVKADCAVDVDGTKRRPPTTAATGNGKSAQLEEVTADTNVSEPGVVVVSFSPRAPGTYSCRVLVSARGAAALDLRCFGLEVLVTAPSVDIALDFKAPARQTITQQIPLVNHGPDEWTLSAAITGSKCFKGPTTIKVPGNAAKATYPLAFCGNWMTPSPEVGTLVLKNPKTGAELR
jgi:hypothetical protein